MPENSIMSISMRSRRQIVEQRFDEQLGLVVEKERAVEEVDADDAQRLLLEGVLLVEHADVDDDLAVLIARVGLEADAHPAVALVGAAEVARRHRVGEGEEGGGRRRGSLRALEVQLVLVVEHGLQALAADVALAPCRRSRR